LNEVLIVPVKKGSLRDLQEKDRRKGSNKEEERRGKERRKEGCFSPLSEGYQAGGKKT